MSYFYGPVNYNGGSELRYGSSLVRGFSPLPTNALNLLDVIELTLTRFLGPKTLIISGTRCNLSRQDFTILQKHKLTQSILETSAVWTRQRKGVWQDKRCSGILPINDIVFDTGCAVTLPCLAEWAPWFCARWVWPWLQVCWRRRSS